MSGVMSGAIVLGCGSPQNPSANSTPTNTATTTTPPDSSATSPSEAAAATSASPAPTANAAAPTPTGKMLTMVEARKYMLELINRDRATQHLAPVTLDEGAPQAAGQMHSDDMAKHGYLGHWGTDGSVPEERMTRAGGSDFDMENALCFTDMKERTLDGKPMIEAAQIEKSESMFFNEVPPNDGHRQNILKPFHKRVGIGVSQPLSTATEIAVPCFSQEFIDPYGTYAPIPKATHVGATLHVSGEIHAPAKFAGVGMSRIEAPKPITVAELNTRRSYPIPQPYQMYWPKGYKTPIVVAVDGNKFSIDVPVSDGGKPGLYEVSVWANVPGAADLVMVSLRTMLVTK
jgi:uncharacterized protein YkwD